MYITIRAIRNYGGMVPAGLIVEPSQIRRFKDKIRDGKIVEITERNKDMYNEYISRMLGYEYSVDTAEKFTGPHYNATTQVEAEELDVEEAEVTEEAEEAEEPDAEEAEEAEVVEAKAVVRPKAVAVSKEA